MPGPEHAGDAVTWGAAALVLLTGAMVAVGALLGRAIKAHDERVKAVVDDNRAANADMKRTVEKLGDKLDDFSKGLADHRTEVAERLSNVEAIVHGPRGYVRPVNGGRD